MSEISRTILSQLGGNRFVFMTGAREIVFRERQLAFRVPSTMTKRRAARVVITWHPKTDLYSIETMSARLKNLDAAHEVGVEQLRSTFESLTGLYTSL